MNYEAIFTRYSWWFSPGEKRIFVITSLIFYNIPQKGESPNYDEVGLLELFSGELITRSWREMVDLYDKHLLEPVTDTVKARFLSNRFSMF